MTGDIVRRLAALIPTLVLVSMLAFGFTELAGGDPAREAAEQGDGDLASDELVAELRSRWGLDDALPVRYVRWLAGVGQGDLLDLFETPDILFHLFFVGTGPGR